MDRLCVLLYSKYSPMSNRLMTALNSCPIDLSTSVGLTTVCIDNEGIRSQILTANKIEISSVPCVLIVYRTGGVEKYEGGNAFQWINETVSKFMPPDPPPVIQEQPPKKIEIVSRKTQRSVPKVEEYESDEDYIPEPVRKPPRKLKFEQPKTSKKETSMEELGIEQDTQSIDYQEGNSGQTEPENYDNSEQKELKRPAQQGKGKDLMATAMAMQKERDSVESNKPRSNGDIVTNNRPI